MNQEQFQSLRDRILGDVVPLVTTTDASADHFDLLLRVIQAGGANEEVYNKAYESAKMLQNSDERLQSLLTLLDEIDFDQAGATESPRADETNYSDNNSTNE